MKTWSEILSYFLSVIGMKQRATCILGKYSTIGPFPYLFSFIQMKSFAFQLCTLYVAWVDTAILVLTKISIYLLKDVGGSVYTK